jgi:CheY-like chemotaxis protein
VHLYTPTTDSLTSGQAFKRVTRGIVRTTKPPRQARLLQTLAKAKNISVTPASQGSAVQGAVNNVAAAKRTLYGNVLIAEDNPVAQQLLVKQLQKHQLNVVATSDGQEAIDRKCSSKIFLLRPVLMASSEWEAHKPGFFTIALFDHREYHTPGSPCRTSNKSLTDMPVCDGVEAARRIRQAEERRGLHISLPSEHIYPSLINPVTKNISITVIALSADAQESTKKMCLSNGFTAFFSKPLKKGLHHGLLSWSGSDYWIGDMANLLSSFGPESSTPP